jgi:hypothetical protein
MKSKKDPHHEAMERTLRAVALIQSFQSDTEEIFPPVDPSTITRAKRQGMEIPQVDPELRHAVNEMLDASAGYDLMECTAESVMAAFRTADADYFRMLAKAAEHVQRLDDGKTVFQKHVLEIRLADADLILAKGKMPTEHAIKKEVIRRLGNIAYGIGEASRWSPAIKAADIQGKRIRKEIKGKRRAK